MNGRRQAQLDKEGLKGVSTDAKYMGTFAPHIDLEGMLLAVSCVAETFNVNLKRESAAKRSE